MRATIVLIFISLVLTSCREEGIPKSLPVEKVYIVEYNFNTEQSSGSNDTISFFNIKGGCELSNNFNLRTFKQSGFNSGTYFETQKSVSDSLRVRIFEVIKNNQKDTSYFYKNGKYDGNYYLFIIERKFYESTQILFVPELLPEDLKFVFDQLYVETLENRNAEDYRDLFDTFGKQATNAMVKQQLLILATPPPPVEE